jgi:hypothetical protein
VREIGGLVRAVIPVLVPVLLVGTLSSPAPNLTTSRPVVAGSVVGTVHPSTGTSAAATLPRHVSRARLIGVLRAASRATEQGLVDGAVWRRARRISWTFPIQDTRFANRGRAKGGSALLVEPRGVRLLVRRETGELFTPLTTWLAGTDIDRRTLDDALVRLGRPAAAWVRSRPWEGRLLEDVSRSLLVGLPVRAEQWSWRVRGRTTEWVITGTTPRPFRVRLVLDATSRVTRFVERREGKPARLSLPVRWDRTAWSIRYDSSVAPVALPSVTRWVGERALRSALGIHDGPVPT